MKILRLSQLLLAAFLQLAPLTRVAPALASLVSPLAVLLRWSAGAVAVLGSFHAVSGASTVISSPTTATGGVGLAFSYQIKTRGHAANRWKWEPLTPTDSLPPGLTLSTASPKPGFILGTPSAAGEFRVRIYASDNWRADRTVFQALTLTITNTGTPPVITGPPAAVTVTEGGSATFNVAATGTAPLAFQWNFNGAALAGRTAATLVLDGVRMEDDGNYTVTVSNPVSAVTSAPGRLTVIAAVVGPVITGPPGDVKVHPGETVSLSVTATGTPPLRYQWAREGVPLAGADAASLSIEPAGGGDAGQYVVTVSGPGGTAMATNQVQVLPLTLMVVGVGETGTTVALTGIIGHRYVLEATDALAPNGWGLLRELSATNELMNVTDPTVDAARFWRASVKP